MIETSLPIVQPETCFSLEQEVINVDDKDYVKRVLRKIARINPVVALWIKNYSKKTKDRLGAIVCAVMVYRLLESQEEADFLNEIIG